ncbi:hypothetical protein AURDEDRAFT_129707 [Auricularia subglabra TFB-10046 SS5]|nr:hypothetical protein AURDEDRAFT_129707 [Auricularia subglabra TFB-10046 SS5]
MHNGYYNTGYGQMPAYGPGYSPAALPPNQGGPCQHSHPPNKQFLPLPIDLQRQVFPEGAYNMQGAQEFPWQGPNMANTFVAPAQGPPQTPSRPARDPGSPNYVVDPETGLRTDLSGRKPAAAAAPKIAPKIAPTIKGSAAASAPKNSDSVKEKVKKSTTTGAGKPKAAGDAEKTEKAAPALKTRFRWTNEPTVKLISYFVAPEVWKDWCLKQATHFTKISVDVFNGEVKPKQIKNAWGRTFRKYKETRRLQAATGGDGDADALDTEDNDLLGFLSDEEDDDDGEQKSKKKKGKKAAAGDDKEDKPEFSASKKEAADPGDSKSDMKAFLKTYSEKTKRQAERDDHMFTLEKEHDKHAEQAFKLQMEEAEARLACEKAAEKQAAHKADECRWAFYERLHASDDPVAQKKAERLAKELLGDE